MILTIIQKLAKLFTGVEKNEVNQKIKKESKDDIIKNIRNLFKLKKVNKAIEDKIISDIRNLFERENEYYSNQ